MAISVVSSVGGSLPRLFRPREVEVPRETMAVSGSLRVRAVPGLAGREDAERPAEASPGGLGETGGRRSRPALDPRRPESILAGSDAAAAGIKGASSPRARLDELLGERAALELRQVEQAGLMSAQTIAVLSQLRSRDSEVRAHEAAHMAAGGSYITGGASYTYERGPDGAEYAVGGEVGIDTTTVPGRPEETVQKMRIVRAAALAPSDPSAADLAVAAEAAQAESEALSEIAQARSEELAGRYEKAVSGAQERFRPSPLDAVA